VAFLIGALAHFRSPGLIDNGFTEESLALRIASLLSAGEWPSAHDLRYPFYPGQLTKLLLAPLFLLFGHAWEIARLWPAALGALTVLLTWLVARDLFGAAAGVLAAVLLAVHPAFVVGAKMGGMHDSWLVFYALACLFHVLRWRRTGEPWRLAFAALLAAAGLATRIWFLWFVAAGAATALVFLRQAVPGPARRRWKEGLLWAAAVLLLGLAPMVRTELARGQNWVDRWIARHPTSERAGQGAGTSLWADVRRKFHRGNLEGRYYMQYCSPRAAGAANKAYVPLFWTAFLACLALALRGNRAVAAALLLFSLIFIQGFAAPGVLPDHLSVLYPWPQVFLAVAAVEGLRRFAARPAARALVLAAVAAAALGDVWVLARFHRELGRSGATGHGTDAVYGLADWARRTVRPGDVLLVNSRELNENLPFFGEGLDVRLIGIDKDFVRDTDRERLAGSLHARGTRYLLLTERTPTDQVGSTWLRKTLEDWGFGLRPLEEFRNGVGRPWAELYRVENGVRGSAGRERPGPDPEAGSRRR
jgi:4-amino-4-deoxy-L-arabinose transferase-like glycosyltransferase